MNQLEAMRDAGVKCTGFSIDDDVIPFANGVTLPILCYTDGQGRIVDDPQIADWCEFGSDEVGYGRYPMVWEEDDGEPA